MKLLEREEFLIVARSSVCNPLLSNYTFCKSNPRPFSDISKSLEDSREVYKWNKMLLLSFCDNIYIMLVPNFTQH
jgi:hypothetical protein